LKEGAGGAPGREVRFGEGVEESKVQTGPRGLRPQGLLTEDKKGIDRIGDLRYNYRRA
jgi:hypothetical protein